MKKDLLEMDKKPSGPVRVRLEFTAKLAGRGLSFQMSPKLSVLSMLLEARFGEAGKVALVDWMRFTAKDQAARGRGQKNAPEKKIVVEERSYCYRCSGIGCEHCNGTGTNWSEEE